MKIRVVLTGRSYNNAASLPAELEFPEGAGIRDALAAIDDHLPEDAKLPPSCMVALAGKHLGNVGNYEDCTLADGQELTLIAPVAGG